MSILTDGKVIPLSVTVDGANRHDKKLVKWTLDAIIFERPSRNDWLLKINIYILPAILIIGDIKWYLKKDIRLQK